MVLLLAGTALLFQFVNLISAVMVLLGYVFYAPSHHVVQAISALWHFSRQYFSGAVPPLVAWLLRRARAISLKRWFVCSPADAASYAIAMFRISASRDAGIRVTG